jgi:TonB family protein
VPDTFIARRWQHAARLLLALHVALAGTAHAQNAPAAGEVTNRPRLTKPPALKQFVEAQYPESEKSAGRAASVVLQIAINAQGTVDDVRVLESAGAAFDEAAVAAVRQFVFEPAEIDHKPSPIRINYKYEFVLKAGATIEDRRGAVFTNPMDRVVKFKTAPIAVTANSPASGDVIEKADPTEETEIFFTFNQSMDLTTWGMDDIEFVGTPTTLTFDKVTATDCTATGSSCRLAIYGVFAPGNYKITLKSGAMFKDVLGNDYVHAMDRVIQFTVEDAPPAPPDIPCLGS